MILGCKHPLPKSCEVQQHVFYWGTMFSACLAVSVVCLLSEEKKRCHSIQSPALQHRLHFICPKACWVTQSDCQAVCGSLGHSCDGSWNEGISCLGMVCDCSLHQFSYTVSLSLSLSHTLFLCMSLYASLLILCSTHSFVIWPRL